MNFKLFISLITISFSSAAFSDVTVLYPVDKTARSEVSIGPVVGRNSTNTGPALKGGSFGAKNQNGGVNFTLRDTGGSVQSHRNTDYGRFSGGVSYNSSSGESRGTVGWGATF